MTKKGMYDCLKGLEGARLLNVNFPYANGRDDLRQGDSVILIFDNGTRIDLDNSHYEIT